MIISFTTAATTSWGKKVYLKTYFFNIVCICMIHPEAFVATVAGAILRHEFKGRSVTVGGARICTVALNLPASVEQWSICVVLPPISSILELLYN